MLIADIMQKNVLTVLPGMNVVELDALLMGHHISGAPVCSEEGMVVGMVSKTDVIRCLSEEFVQLDRPISEVLVRDIMTPKIVAVDIDDDVVTVARTMLNLHVHRVVVYDADQLVGIVSSFDMLRVVVEFKG